MQESIVAPWVALKSPSYHLTPCFTIRPSDPAVMGSHIGRDIILEPVGQGLSTLAGKIYNVAHEGAQSNRKLSAPSQQATQAASRWLISKGPFFGIRQSSAANHHDPPSMTANNSDSPYRVRGERNAD